MKRKFGSQLAHYGARLPDKWHYAVSIREKEAAESHSEWSTTAIKKLKEASPLSLKVTLQSVTVLLKECRDIQLRCGSANNDIDGDAMINCADQITVESDAQRIISERLVNFKDINGLVERNTQLRSLVRRLLDQIKNREAELKEPIAPYDDVAYIFFKDYEKGGWFISFTRVACYPFGQPENFSYCHMGRVQKEAKGSAR